ncbi:MAG: HAMP domain-containing histidine kinase [Sarcina sp.]|nr:HAMP domain-containing histidine kinase [Sarcina sp.]
MRKSLYLRIIIAYLLFGLFGFIAVATVISRVTTDYCIRNRARALYGEATRISDSYATELYNSRVSLETVQGQMEALSAYMETEIWILNPSGRMIVNSRQAPNPSEETIVEGFDSTYTAGNYYMTGTFFDSFEEEVLSVIAPITSNFKIRGYVVIHLPMAVIRKDVDGMLNIAYMELVILIVLSLIILFFFTEYVYRPLQRIIRAAEQYALGNMRYRIPVEREDEMGYLSASLGYMAETIARAEDDQKKFIANVSHDFRSPLTSIRGFLEAMLDGTIPPEMHEHYIGVVLKETDRLTKLTNGLLTLNNLNTGGMLLQRTDFDINAVIRSVAASFEQTCRTRNIRINLVLTGKILYVNADLEKIQQVLYNLVDNALKFSSNDSEISIETTEKGDTVFVSVRDSGIGIPRDDQKLIWDRFYKTDLSRGKDKKGTGLGLSIVREIIRAHEENINLVSTEGVGSTFTFTLRRSDHNDELNEEGEIEITD